MREIFFSKRALNDRTHLSPDVEHRIIQKLEHYQKAPDPLKFAKRLHDDPEGTYRFEIADWRVKFFIRGGAIVITRILHRSVAYRR